METMGVHQNVETLVPWLLRHSIAGDQLVYSRMFIPHQSRLPDTVTKTLLHVAADLFILGSHDKSPLCVLSLNQWFEQHQYGCVSEVEP